MAGVNDVIGPVDYLVLQMPTDRRDGSIAAALLDLVESGTVTILDVMLVQKDEEGVVSGIELDTIDGELTAFAGARSGLLDQSDQAEAGAALEPGTTAAVLVYENAWARPFVAAARTAGADVIASARIPADVLNSALDALDQ
ncbi:MAG: hypothetical protein JJLCMIEE_02057 [Acidimicrobiales bacterium]|nr:MAG: DUF1269 domain-containing protein [Actinomycetota bacterium]MBV6508990.1 hypothetical protein [Acidimicrobiales bacterium]RIK06296.1 MAG: DUF1269 domain-containing family protein [Acidobacteriota bacterium]